MRRTAFALAAFAGLLAAFAQPDDQKLLGELKSYDYNKPRAPLRALELLIARSRGEHRERLADKLVALFTDPATPMPARRFIAKQLPLLAAERHVPAIAKLLDDPKTAEMARRVLEAIPGEQSLAALRGLLRSAKGKLLVGAINSLGVRRDATAVELLAPMLGSREEGVASAAAEALGKIATPQAAEALRKAAPPEEARPFVREALLRCARTLSKDNPSLACEIFEESWKSATTAHERIAALTGIAGASPKRALPILDAALQSKDPLLRAAALELAAGAQSPELTPTLLRLLGQAQGADKARLVRVLGRRADRSALPAIVGMLNSKDDAVRLAAVEATATLGDVECVEKLLVLAASGAGATQAAARRALALMKAPGTDKRLRQFATHKDPRVRAEALRTLSARGTEAARDALVAAASDQNAQVRQAALEGLAQLGDERDFPKLLAILLAEKDPANARLAEKALAAIGQRAKDKSACVAAVISLLGKAPPAAKATTFRLLAGLGGPKALATVTGELKSSDQRVVEGAVRALSSWGDTAACPALLEVASTSGNKLHRTLALRGYLRLAGEAPSRERLALLERARALATNAEAKRMLLASLGELDNAGAAEFAASFLADAQVEPEAAAALLRIGERLLRTDRHAARRAAEQLLARTKDPAVSAKAKKLLLEASKRRRRTTTASVPRHDPKRSQRIKAQLAKRMPKGYCLACYLDCGPDASDGKKGGPLLRLVSGQPYMWAGSALNGDTRYGSIAFAATEVVFEATGLDPRRGYQLGFSWWDFDHATRRQSVWAETGNRRVRLLPPTKLPSGARGEKPAAMAAPLPREVTNRGSARIIFRNEGQPNAVVSEIWLSESEAQSNAPPPSHNSQPRLVAPPLRDGQKARVLIVTGIDYPGHKWRQTAPALKEILEKDPRLGVTIAEDPNLLADPALGKFDVILLHFMPWKAAPPTKAARENLAKVVASGTGMVVVHFACGAFPDWPEFVKLAGKVYDRRLRGHDPRGPFKVRIVNHDHPITRGLNDFETNDELYTCLAGKAPVTVLAVARSRVDGKDYPMAFVLNYGKGRVFHSPLGHDVVAYRMPGVAELLRRGTAWAAGLAPVPAERRGQGQ